jgi:hypothetical protein
MDIHESQPSQRILSPKVVDERVRFAGVVGTGVAAVLRALGTSHHREGNPTILGSMEGC